MPQDKYSAVWVSHTSISDFLRCPKSYFLNNVYKDPSTGHKIKIIQPPLALGQAVHEVLESLSVIPTKERFNTPLVSLFEKSWEKVSGKLGGFFDSRTEHQYKERGIEMLSRVSRHPGPLANKAVKIKQDLPHYWLSETDSIMLCGKIDWLEYIEANDSVHIIDFKTGNRREDPDSLQLPIYYLLTKQCQHRKVAKASYWYLMDSDELEIKELPDEESSYSTLISIAKKIKLARQFKKFECSQGSECRWCAPMQSVVDGKAEFVTVNEFNQDIYVINSQPNLTEASEIL